MGYKSEIYRNALQIKKNMVKDAEASFESALSSLRAENTLFCQIETNLAKLGPEIALSALDSDNKKLADLRKKCDELNKKREEILASKGIKKPSAFCHVCGDSGYSNGKYCECVEIIAKGLVFEELSKTLPIGNCSFENFDLGYYPDALDENGQNPKKRATAILTVCKNFVRDFQDNPKSLLFMGGVGLGKTHLSLSIVKEISEGGFGVVYGPAGTLFSAVEKEHFSYSGETNKLDALLDCDLLVIDDLGTEFLSSFTSSLFYNIINTRLLANKPTIINTNLTYDELETRYTPRITSRFIGNYDMRVFLGMDIRQQKRLK